MGTKNNPGSFDCYANAHPDEPMFVLLARDISAPSIVESWAAARARLIADGIKPADDRAMVEEARECAKDMRRWRVANRAGLEGPVNATIDVIARALCRAECAFRGEPPCYSLPGAWPNPECAEPGCHTLAREVADLEGKADA